VCTRLTRLQAFSTFALEALLHSAVMGYPSVFTDHSLFGFADASSIHMNKLLKIVFSNVSHVICVSNTRCAPAAATSALSRERI
jgi:phosphatidylinositol glycan class A protein